MTDNATVKIRRFDPTVDTKPRYKTYKVPPEGWQGVKVIETIRYIYEHFDPGLSFREPCRQQICGACIVVVNNKPVLACDSFSEKDMVIEPLPNRRPIKYLVVDLVTRQRGRG